MATTSYHALQEAGLPIGRPRPAPPMEAAQWDEQVKRELLKMTRATQTKGARLGPGPKCPVCERPLGSLTLPPPYRVEIETWGRDFGDIMYYGNHTLIVSDVARRVFEQHQFRLPANLEEVTVEKVRKHRKVSGNLPKYFKLTVPIGPARIDQKASEFKWKAGEPICPHCLWPKKASLLSYKRVVIENGTWDGHDVFKAHGSPVHFIVTERFKNACEANGLKNVAFEALENCSWEKPAWWP